MKRLLMWIYGPKITFKNHHSAKQKEQAYRIKMSFRRFLEGDPYSHGINSKIKGYSITQFGITDIQFDFLEKETKMNITLERPGLLIGRQGHLITAITEHLNSAKFPIPTIKIYIIESNIWHYPKKEIIGTIE